MKSHTLIGIIAGFFVSLPWLALMYAGQLIAALPLVPFELFELLTRSLPGGVVSISIEWMVQIVSTLRLGQTSTTGKLIEIALAYLLALACLSALGGLFALTLQRLRFSWILHGIIAGLFLTALTMLIADWGITILSLDTSWLLITSFAWGLGLAWGVNRYFSALSENADLDRRRVLGELAIGSLALTGLAIGLGRWLTPASKPIEIATDLATPEPTIPPPTPPPTSTGFKPVPGTRPEITPIEEFYRVDINLLPPGDEEFLDVSDPLVRRLLAQGGETDLPANTYVLVVDGLVKEPLTLSLADLKAFPQVNQYGTLECISNPVGGDLIGTTLFQGARLKDVLEKSGLEESVFDIKFTCVDGYSESLPVQAAMHPETLLCHSMGNQPLTEKHGSPIRLYTPNRFGMKNPKWIIRIDAIDSDYKGFWQKRGWSESAFVITTSVIDTTIPEINNLTQVGGIAFAGARGIEAVELSVDESAWVPVELDRPLSALTWILWRASLELAPGEHTITVRAIDGEGETQTGKPSKTHPSGATGYHSKRITIPS